MDKEARIESSVPVQGRVSIVTLAELEMYWAKEGVRIKTLSQLLSWSVEAFRGILEANGKLPGIVESVADAHNYLEDLGLYQPGLKGRSMKKIVNAMSLESLRAEGFDPRVYAKQQYNTVHRTNTQNSPPIVKLSQEEVRAQWRKEQTEKKQHTNTIDDDEWDSIQKRLREEKEKDRLRELEIAKNSNYCIRPGEELKEGMSDEELAEYNRKRDEEIIARENAPMSEEDMKSAIVKDDLKFE